MSDLRYSSPKSNATVFGIPRIVMLLSILMLVLGTYIVVSARTNPQSSSQAAGVPSVAQGVTASDCVFKTPGAITDAFNSIVKPGGSEAGWAAGDGYISSALPGGKSLLLFGDTFVGKTNAGKTESVTSPTIVRNTGLVYSPNGAQNGSCFTQSLGKTPSGLMPDANDTSGVTSWWWPGTIIPSKSNPNVFTVLAYQMAKTGMGAWDSKITANGVFTLTYNPVDDTVSSSPVTVLHNQPGGTGDYGTVWAASSYVTPQYVYVYGTQRSHKPLVFGRMVHVARIARNSDLANTSNWEYQNKNGGWTRGPQTSLSTLVQAENGASTVFSVVKNSNGNPTIITKENDFLGTRVMEFVMATPFSKPTTRNTLFATPKSSPKALTYIALTHPEIPAPAGKTWVSLNRNTDDIGETFTDVTKYQAEWHLVSI